MLRRRGYEGALTLIDPDRDAPYDRPNLSKDYLAGNAPEEWLPLWPEDFCERHNIKRVHAHVRAIDVAAHQVTLDNEENISYDALLLATGARPRGLPTPGIDLPHVHMLRSLADCRGIIAAIANKKNAVVIGSSFIGLEVAASLRARSLDVTVVAPEKIPFARVFGDELGTFVKRLHEEKGVKFFLEQTATRITADSVELKNGTVLPADVVIVGVGVAPITDIAEAAGLRVDNGVLVNEFFETSAPGIYAVGDIARWPDRYSGEPIRVEHWVVAQRQGQAAAHNILGLREPFNAVPFFWTQQYDAAINYLGHASHFDKIIAQGNPAERDYSARLLADGRELARVTIFRDQESLQREAELTAGK
jgi:NADPH-dependent 2,4-dienoyl-CoA reductase/sulfur reductase-like enzyme